MKKSWFFSACLVLCFTFIITSQAISGDWEPVAAPSTNSYSCIWVNTADDIFIGTTAGEILHYDGTTWSRMYTATTSGIQDIWASSSTDVFAAAGNGTILHYGGVGSAWTKMNTGTGYHMMSVWGSSPNDVYALGSYFDAKIFHYDGTAWSEIAGSYPGTLTNLWGTSADNVYAVGTSGRILHFDGSAWSAMTSKTSYSLQDIWGSAANDIYAVGDCGTIVHFNGTAWSVVTTFNPGMLYGVWLNAADDVYAAGSGGEIRHFDGTNWSTMVSGTASGLSGVGGSGAGNVYAVGYQGLLLRHPAIQSALPVDHFDISLGTDPKLAGVPFQIEVTAKDNNGAIVSEYSGNVRVAIATATGALPVTPLVSGTFFQGSWTGAIAVGGTGTQAQIAVDDLNGRTGLSLPFDLSEDTDTDGDTVTDAIENDPNTCSAVDNPDTDGDGLTDGAEDANRNGLPDPGETNACNSDSDGDTLDDGDEISLYQTNPQSADTDNDTLADGLEVNVYGTSPKFLDSDADGINDGAELAYWGAAWNADNDGDGKVNLLDIDADNDGFKDGKEITDGTDPADPLSPPYDWGKIAIPSSNLLSAIWVNAANDIFIGTSAGEILHFDGTTWSAMTTGTTYQIKDIWASSSTDVFAVAANDTILHYNGVGSACTKMSSGTGYHMNAVWGSGPDNVYVVGTYADARIFHYDGAAWSQVPGSYTGNLSSLWGTAADNIYAVGSSGRILHFDGSAWTAMTSKTSCALNDIRGSAANDVYAVGDMGTIVHFDGTAWSVVTTNNSGGLYAVWLNSTDNVFAVGANGEIRHFDGTAWSFMVSGTKNYLYEVAGSSADNVYAVGAQGLLLHFPAPPAPLPLDHFDISSIESPRRTNVPFNVSISAKDSAGGTIDSYNGPLLISAGGGPQDLTIGNALDVWAFPLATNFHDARTQVIYLAEEIGGAKTIQGIALDVTAPPGQALTNFTIRMKHTSLDDFNLSRAWENDWTVVYQATTTVSATGWVSFAFQTPFAYNGSDNLMVDFSFNNDSKTTTGFCHFSTYGTYGTLRTLYDTSDSNLGDPLNWSGTNAPTPTVGTLVPDIRLIVSGPASIGMTSNGSFLNGVWSGSVTIQEPSPNIFLSVGDGAGHAGQSNLFDVLPNDSDGDGLSDSDEINLYGTDPLDADSDDDSLADGEEIRIHGTSPILADSDGDGSLDGAEAAFWSANWNADPDGDGIINILDADSDNDLYQDGAEITAGADPGDADSRPLDHFEVSAIASPQHLDTPFHVTVSAKDAGGHTLAGFSGPLNILAQSGSGPAETPIGAGTATWGFPLYTWYHDARTQVIYLSEEIGGPRTIRGLALDVATRPGQTLNNWTIRMRHTPLDNYASARAWENSWTVAYQGTTTISTTGWVTFTFPTPFAYNGTDNLMVDFSFNNSSYTSYGNCRYFSDGTQRALYYNTDSGYGDPLNWSGTAAPTPNVSYNVPNIKLITNPVSVGMDVNGSIVNGVWTGTIAIRQTGQDIRLLIEDDAEHVGQSNAFHVLLPDNDNDGLPDSLENMPSVCTEPMDADSDDDLLLDGEEDADRDGILDAGETNPCNSDSDDDGLPDGDELNIHGTDPLDADIDNDGLTDGEEINLYGTQVSVADSDGDGALDGAEFGYWGQTGWDDDNDQDGLINLLDSDSDNDGYLDGAEIDASANPGSSDSRPLDRFEISAVDSPQAVNSPFELTISAKDAAGGTIAGYSGPLNITASSDGGGAGEVSVVGTASWAFPLYTYYHDARTQSIYLAEEIGGPKTIQGLALDVASLPGQTLTNWTIRMRHTPLDSYASVRAWENAWTVVYRGTTTITATGWVNFTFQTPFNYNGTDNLMIDFSFNNSSWTSSGNCRYFSDGTQRTLYYNTDSAYGDPLNWSGTTSPTPRVIANVPNIKLTTDGPASIGMSIVGEMVDGMWSGSINMLEPGETVFLQVADGHGVLDESNRFDVLAQALDITAPQVVSVQPESGAAQMVPTALIRSTFSEAVDPSSLTNASFAISNGASNLNGQIQCQGATVTFIPEQFLAYDTTYTVTLTTNIKDLAGNALEAPHSWSFTTTDQIYSSWTTVYPTIAAYAVDGGESFGWVVDGAMDAIYPRTQYQEHVYVKKYESLDFTKYMDCRALYEFALPARLSGNNVQIDAVVLHASTSATPSGYDGNIVNLRGYAGDGLAQLSDFNLGTDLGLFNLVSNPEIKLEADLTNFVASLIGTSAHAGFILQPGPYATDQHVSFWNGIPNPAFGTISGQIVRLVIDFTVLDE